jgi:hypothetical protein
MSSFTPRLSGAGEYKIVAKELLGYAKEVAPAEVMMLPWKDHSGLGPIKEEDLVNLKIICILSSIIFINHHM